MIMVVLIHFCFILYADLVLILRSHGSHLPPMHQWARFSCLLAINTRGNHGKFRQASPRMTWRMQILPTRTHTFTFMDKMEDMSDDDGSDDEDDSESDDDEPAFDEPGSQIVDEVSNDKVSNEDLVIMAG